MKYLGIDYGKKNVGIATSDEEGILAFPLTVLSNTYILLDTIKKICLEKKIEKIVVGESLDFSGAPNPIMEEIETFKKTLEKELGLPVFLEPEFLTTKQSHHIQGESNMTDASAAAIILQSYLDKNK